MSAPRTYRASVILLVVTAATGAGSVNGQRSSAGTNKVPPVVASRVDALVQARMSDCESLNIGVVKDAKVVFVKAYGNGRLNGEYEYGSVSKPVTSMIVMQLRHQGVITSLDDPVWKYLPKYAGAMPAAYKGQRLTLKQLLTHRSGIPHNEQPMFIGGKFNLQFASGTAMLYSTPGYGLLGEVIQAVTELSYSDAVRKYIGEPVDAPSLRAESSYIAPGAFVVSTIEDMARFAIGVMANRYIPADLLYNEVLKPEIGDYGYGWRVANVGTEQIAASHGGSNGLPRAHVLIRPREKQAVVILAQMNKMAPLDLPGLADEVLKALREVQ